MCRASGASGRPGASRALREDSASLGVRGPGGVAGSSGVVGSGGVAGARGAVGAGGCAGPWGTGGPWASCSGRGGSGAGIRAALRSRAGACSPAYASLRSSSVRPPAGSRAHTVLLPGRYVTPQASQSAATSGRPRPYSGASYGGASCSVPRGAREGCRSETSTTSAPVPSSSRHVRCTSVPACTTALVTSSLAISVASSPTRPVRCSAPGSPRSAHSVSALRSRARAEPGARGLPGRTVSTRASSRASKAPETVSRCVGMAPMGSSRTVRTRTHRSMPTG